MPRTSAEVLADITTVNSAIQEIIQGTRLTQLRVGSGDYVRLYTMQECTVEILQDLLAQLNQELALIQGVAPITFRQMSNIPLTVVKFRA